MNGVSAQIVRFFFSIHQTAQKYDVVILITIEKLMKNSIVHSVNHSEPGYMHERESTWKVCLKCDWVQIIEHVLRR